jgi:DNA-binding transcriptional ArsR family regulator
MPETLADILERLDRLERRVAVLEGEPALPDAADTKSIMDSIYRLKEQLMESRLQGRPRPPRSIEFLSMYTVRRGTSSVYGGSVVTSPDDYEQIISVSEEEVARVASCLANPTRVKIIKALLEGDKTSSELTAAIGIAGGPLYHHLRELAHGGFLASGDRRLYKLSSMGMDLAVSFLVHMATQRLTSPEEKLMGDIPEDE